DSRVGVGVAIDIARVSRDVPLIARPPIRGPTEVHPIGGGGSGLIGNFEVQPIEVEIDKRGIVRGLSILHNFKGADLAVTEGHRAAAVRVLIEVIDSLHLITREGILELGSIDRDACQKARRRSRKKALGASRSENLSLNIRLAKHLFDVGCYTPRRTFILFASRPHPSTGHR